MKIKPFEKWLASFVEDGYTKVISYVGIRFDEGERVGYVQRGKKKKIEIVSEFPLQKAGICVEEVFEILEESGLGIPEYYKWRSRSGCTFCFFQRRIEWVGLLENHPEAFKRAMAMEKVKTKDTCAYTWIRGLSLKELSKPKKVADIKKRWERRTAREKEKEEQLELCMTCHK